MRNPMLRVSPMSNDGFLQHKPTLAPAGLDRCSLPLAGVQGRLGPHDRRVRSVMAPVITARWAV